MISLLLAIIYLAFVSLGLPDALLGAAWPSMCVEFAVPVSYAGAISMIISFGTVTSSLLSDRLTRRFGTGLVTAVSVAMTAVALLGFSLSHSYWMLLLWAIPYGLGAGAVDAALNNYVALHFASRHMSWLHCMWGVGASLGPSIMGIAIRGGQGWNGGYRIIGLIQVALSVIVLLSIPLWKRQGKTAAEPDHPSSAPLRLKDVLRIPGAKEILLAFFCYSAAEQTAILWGSTYLVGRVGVPEETAATLATLFVAGITIGRGANGFLTYRLSDRNLIRLGQSIMVLGICAMILPLGQYGAMAGLLLIGLGCAPIYPSIIHSTPAHFGPENSQAVIGVQMAAAYVGSLSMPPIFGLMANHIHVGLFPAFLAVITAIMILMSERLNRIAKY